MNIYNILIRTLNVKFDVSYESKTGSKYVPEIFLDSWCVLRE